MLLDPDLSRLCDVIINGWPDLMKDTPEPLRGFWSCCDELSVEALMLMSSHGRASGYPKMFTTQNSSKAPLEALRSQEDQASHERYHVLAEHQ